MPPEPVPIADALVRYTAPEMPTERIAQLQTQTTRDLDHDEVSLRDAFRIVNLLLTIALMKLEAPT